MDGRSKGLDIAVAEIIGINDNEIRLAILSTFERVHTG
jgi:hypothetical protein